MNRRQLSLGLAIPLFFLLILAAQARVIRLEITSRQSPTFGGRAFTTVGPYEKLRGKVYGELDPNSPQLAAITDLKLAPRNARGMVEYSMDFYILKPIDLQKGNHKLLLEVNNRGNKLLGNLNQSRADNDPATAADAGEAFLMKRGYTLVWNGWDPSATSANNGLTISVPIARNGDGSSITGPSYEYIVYDNPTSTRHPLAYPAATLTKSQARLTVRQHLQDVPQDVPTEGWAYIDERTIGLLPAGTPFRQSAIYEFTYTARDPMVAGIGFAATRDYVSFLRYATTDEVGHPNPLANAIQYTFSFAVSQPARYLNDFQTLGFNADEQGLRVLDGIENWLGGSSGIGLTVRFAQPSRTERNRQNHLYPEAMFPFAYPVLSDPFTGKTAGRLAACSSSHTCPKVFEINSANEYWVKAASLLHTDLKGHDLADPDNVRFFLVSGAQHGTGNDRSRGPCQQFQNPTDAGPLLRALLMALEDWVVKGTSPPPSAVPRQSTGTAVRALAQTGAPTGIVPQAALGWPTIPGVKYTGLITTRYQLDFGPSASQGLLSLLPPPVAGRPVYPNVVSKVDQDGNELAGIRLPPVAAPTATTTGWALRGADFGGDDGCEGAGQTIPFRATKAARLAAHDPRLSLAERYQTHAGYVRAVRRCVKALVHRRLLLAEDAQAYRQMAEASTVLK